MLGGFGLLPIYTGADTDICKGGGQYKIISHKAYVQLFRPHPQNGYERAQQLAVGPVFNIFDAFFVISFMVSPSLRARGGATAYFCMGGGAAAPIAHPQYPPQPFTVYSQNHCAMIITR